MIRKETGILILILAALVGLAWYLNQPNSPTKGTPTVTPTVTTPTYLFPNDSKSIAGFVLTSQDGASFSLQRGPGGIWMVKQPIEGIADQAKGEESASGVAALRVITTLESAPPTSATGLDKPGYTLTVTTTDGKTLTAQIGKATVTNTGYYVTDDVGKVQVISKSNIDTLVALMSNPPYAETPTPSPMPSDTPPPSPTNIATLEPTGTSKP